MIFDIDNKNYFASDAGQGIDKNKDTIVLLHGSGLSHIVWSLIEQYLSNQNYNILAIDLPGHGNSEGESLKSIEEISEWLEKVFNKLEKKDGVDIGSKKYKKNLALTAFSEVADMFGIPVSRLSNPKDNLRKKENLEITIIINKIDLIRKSKILDIIAPLANLGFEEIIPVSASSGDGIADLRIFLEDKCKHPDWLYNEDEITDAPMRFIASEITREKLFLHLNQELPKM